MWLVARYTYGPFPLPYDNPVIAILDDASLTPATLYDPNTDAITTGVTLTDRGFYFRVEEGYYLVITRHSVSGPSGRTRVRVGPLGFAETVPGPVNNPTVGGVYNDYFGTAYAAPGAPRTPAASEVAGDVQVTWTAPLSDGGMPVTNYVVTTTPADVGPVVVGNTLSATVTGLLGETAYTFTVHAVNAIGSGPESVATNSVQLYGYASAYSGGY